VDVVAFQIVIGGGELPGERFGAGCTTEATGAAVG
jgi:hypothetical protein